MTHDAREERQREQRRKAVEHAFGVYVMTDADVRMKLNAAVLVTSKVLEAFSDERDLHNWRMTFGLKLTRMRNHCGLCRPRLARCEHAESLVRHAQLHSILGNCRSAITTYDRQLGSQTTKRRMSEAAVSKVKQMRTSAHVTEAKATTELRSLVHRSSYQDAHDLFVLACGDEKTLAYCLMAGGLEGR